MLPTSTDVVVVVGVVLTTDGVPTDTGGTPVSATDVDWAVVATDAITLGDDVPAELRKVLGQMACDRANRVGTYYGKNLQVSAAVFPNNARAC